MSAACERNCPFCPEELKCVNKVFSLPLPKRNFYMLDGEYEVSEPGHPERKSVVNAVEVVKQYPDSDTVGCYWGYMGKKEPWNKYVPFRRAFEPLPYGRPYGEIKLK
jgi:hypothetical protein